MLAYFAGWRTLKVLSVDAVVVDVQRSLYNEGEEC